MKKIRLDGIDNNCEGYQKLIDLYKQIKDTFFEDIELSISSWFSANLSAPLGGIIDLSQENLNSFIFKLPDKIKRILQKNDFLSHFNYNKINDIYMTTIKYLKLRPSDSRFFYEFIINELLNYPELPKMTRSLKKKIAESIFEIFENAKLHSGSNFVYTCGQFFPTKHIIEFTIADTGIGFKDKINQTFNWNLSSIDAIKWALIEGHSTKKDIPGGIGLAILKEFIVLNKGRIQIISDNGFYQIDKNGEFENCFNGSFPGTIVNIQFRTDDNNLYFLDEEKDEIF